MSSTLDPATQRGFDTVALHGGHSGDPATKSRAVPIYQTTSYTFDDTAHAERLFALQEFGNIYTRIMNPTTDVLEQRLAALEGGVGALAVASGQAANVYAILNLARAGDHIVSAAAIYGGTHNAFVHTLPRFGIETSLVDARDPAKIAAAIRPNTKAVYAETISNPRVDVLDVEALAKVAHDAGIPLIIDNTIATPYLLRPIEYGADVVVHSATKFIGGHGTTIGGAIVDAGRFDWAASGKFADFTEPDASYHGVKYVEAFGPLAYIIKARVQLLRDIGAALSPFNAWLLAAGDRDARTAGGAPQRERAAGRAGAARRIPRCSGSATPGCPAIRRTTKAQKYLPKGAGAVAVVRGQGRRGGGARGDRPAAALLAAGQHRRRASRSRSTPPRPPTSSSRWPTRSSAA